MAHGCNAAVHLLGKSRKLRKRGGKQKTGSLFEEKDPLERVREVQHTTQTGDQHLESTGYCEKQSTKPKTLFAPLAYVPQHSCFIHLDCSAARVSPL